MLIESCARTSFYARALWVYEGFSEVSKLPSKRRPSVFLMLVPDRLLTERTDRPTRKTRISISAKSTALWFWSVLSFSSSFTWFQQKSIVRMLKLHLHRLLVSSWLSVPGGEELVAAVDPRRRGVVIAHLVWKWFLGKNLLWIFLSLCTLCTAFRSVPVSPVSCCQTAWLRKTASGGVMGGAHDRLLRCGPGPEARITLPLAVPHNKIDSHCAAPQHHSLHSLIRDWLSAQSHVTTFATSASVISR